MKKNIIIYAGIVVLVVVIVVIFFFGKNNKGILDECIDLCTKAEVSCPELIDENSCLVKCSDFSDETKNHIKESNSCLDLIKKLEAIAGIIIPETEGLEAEEHSTDCEAACGKYVMSCLTLVPNATEALFEEGFNSCLEECSEWTNEKVDCMINVFNCEAMTNECEL